MSRRANAKINLYHFLLSLVYYDIFDNNFMYIYIYLIMINNKLNIHIFIYIYISIYMYAKGSTFVDTVHNGPSL